MSLEEAKAELLADKARGFNEFNLWVSVSGLRLRLVEEERETFDAWAEEIINVT